MGYTLNRVSLFALIFSIGILVDDAIVVIENIDRHWGMDRRTSRVEAAIDAVAEVGNPTIVATLMYLGLAIGLRQLAGDKARLAFQPGLCGIGGGEELRGADTRQRFEGHDFERQGVWFF